MFFKIMIQLIIFFKGRSNPMMLRQKSVEVHHVLSWSVNVYVYFFLCVNVGVHQWCVNFHNRCFKKTFRECKSMTDVSIFFLGRGLCTLKI